MVTAAAEAGSLGFLAGGSSSVKRFRTELAQVSGRFGVNLFRPQGQKPTPSDVDEVAGLLTQAFRGYGLGDPAIPTVDLSNGWEEKFRLAVAARPSVISCTFGLFTPDEFATLKQAGIEAWVTVTNTEDARTAERAGADVLVVQGPEAGGHRSTWSLTEEPDGTPLDELVRAVLHSVRIPVVAAGGVTTRADVVRVLDLGAAAVACGSAFLLAEEAGTSAANRELLLSAADRGLDTICSRGFSGRYARGVATRFVKENDSLPPVYPYLNAVISPLRAAAGATGNWDYAYCLVGTGIGNIKPGSVKQILSTMNPSV